ncbi:ABC transporter substrate-binding protein [Streptomyces tremellae]|uniref:Fe/B12 periplasmic-binding domain-containing protein n=1 Tax=Streptomyces tremellae TaxID=1124239 RepID=A0ABP7FWS3_9ACTN
MTWGYSSAQGGAAQGAVDGCGKRRGVRVEDDALTVDKKPARILALGRGDAEPAQDLGAQPVGASDWLASGGDGVGPWAKGPYKKKPGIIGTLEPSRGKIAALRPDLILDTASSGDAKPYRTLSRIAPTVDVPKGQDAYKTSWQEQIRMIAAALGKKGAGSRLIAGVDKKFVAAAKARPESEGETISVGAPSGDGYGACVKGDSRISFAERPGFTNNPNVGAKAGSSTFLINVSRSRARI